MNGWSETRPILYMFPVPDQNDVRPGIVPAQYAG